MSTPASGPTTGTGPDDAKPTGRSRFAEILDQWADQTGTWSIDPDQRVVLLADLREAYRLGYQDGSRARIPATQGKVVTG